MDLEPTTPQTALSPPEVKRRRLLDVAERLFALHGPNRVTVAEIAAAARVSKGLTYVHFRSKDELFAAVVGRVVEQWTSYVDEAADRQSTVCDALAALHDSSLEFAERHPLLQRLFEDPSQALHHRLSASTADSQHEFVASLIARVEQGIASGELRQDLDARVAARTFYLLHVSFFQQLDHSRPTPALPFDPTAEPVRSGAVQLLLRGLRREDAHRE